MEDGLFPSYMSITEGSVGELEEERRLCYVGITRAKEKLILTAAKRRMVRGETQLNRVSRFVNEIPKEFVIVQGQNTQNSFGKSPDIFNTPPRKPGQVAFQSYQKEIISKGVFDKKNTSTEELSYGEGDRVKHIKFGEGTVKSIINGGRDYEVTVEFDNFGTKKMFASFAKLTKI
jgi:DNA helicase-2/ATP-dependent DNA helicase PcrA